MPVGIMSNKAMLVFIDVLQSVWVTPIAAATKVAVASSATMCLARQRMSALHIAAYLFGNTHLEAFELARSYIHFFN